jgi:hypothetical protein
MADTKISGLAESTGANIAAADLFPFVDVSDTSMAASGTDKYAKRDQAAVGLLNSGWLADNVTWKYSTSTVFLVPGNAAAYIGPGCKVSWNDGGLRYGVVSATVYFGYTLSNVSSGASNTFTKTAHAISQFGPIVFSGLVNTTGVTNGVPYFAVGITANTFQVSDSYAGAPITISGVDTTIGITGGTSVTLIANGTYSIANATLTAPRYSYDDAPIGFLRANIPIPLAWMEPPITLLGTDTLWAAAGDIAVGTGNDTATILPVIAAAGDALRSDPGATNKISWGNPLSVSDAQASTTTTSVLAASYNRIYIPSSAVVTAQTGGTVYLYGICLPKGMTVTTVTFWAGTTAGATNTHTWAGLYSSGRTNVAVSSDITTAAWTASALRTFTMTTPYLVTADAFFYIGLALVGGTIPTIESVTGLLTAGSRLATPRPDMVTALTGVTTPVTTTPGLGSTSGSHAYFEIA